MQLRRENRRINLSLQHKKRRDIESSANDSKCRPRQPEYKDRNTWKTLIREAKNMRWWDVGGEKNTHIGRCARRYGE
jgi:hypothetical protein